MLAVLGLLDRTAQLTNLKSATSRREPLTREAALKTAALAEHGPRQHESGMDVLRTAASFKITCRRCHSPYGRVACLRDRGVSP
jgi:hypothetical protein